MNEEVVEDTFTFPTDKLKISGEQPAGGTATIDKDGNIAFALYDKDKKWCVKKHLNSEKVYTEDYKEETCNLDGIELPEEKPGDGGDEGGEVPEPNSFATDSWETIAANVKAGNLSKYKVGDEKEVTLTGEYAGTYTVRIANTSKPAECNGTDFSQSACGFVVEFKDIIAKAKMNSSNTNAGGWPSSPMYTLVNTTIYNSLPEDLKNAIIKTDVVSSHGASSSSNFKSTDKLYLLATKEIFGKEGTSNTIDFESSDNQTRQLDYYKSKGVTTSNYSGTNKQYQGSNAYWWLRSVISYSNNGFYRVISSGGWSTTSADDTNGVAPAFRIG